MNRRRGIYSIGHDISRTSLNDGEGTGLRVCATTKDPREAYRQIRDGVTFHVCCLSVELKIDMSVRVLDHCIFGNFSLVTYTQFHLEDMFEEH